MSARQDLQKSSAGLAKTVQQFALQMTDSPLSPTLQYTPVVGEEKKSEIQEDTGSQGSCWICFAICFGVYSVDMSPLLTSAVCFRSLFSSIQQGLTEDHDKQLQLPPRIESW